MGSGFAAKLAGALYGGAIGDGMGAPVEGWAHADIWQRYGTHDFHRFLPINTVPHPIWGAKGDGRITDDTLMTEVLIHAYLDRRDHLEALDYAEVMHPLMRARDVFVPEQQRAIPLWERLAGAEQLPWLKMAMNQDPRQAGLGNAVNCGLAMWMMPVGAVNAGDPVGAYREALLLGVAHNSSYALEAGAVMAAATAAALGANATVDAVLDTALTVSRDGTHFAIVDCLAAVHVGQTIPEFVRAVQEAFEPYAPQHPHPRRNPGLTVTDHNLPSRVSSIQELPAALAAFKYGQGDFLTTLAAAVFHGCDTDSIAAMAATLSGALHGLESIPTALRNHANQVNRRDFNELAQQFAGVCVEMHASDARRFLARTRALE